MYETYIHRLRAARTIAHKKTDSKGYLEGWGQRGRPEVSWVTIGKARSIWVCYCGAHSVFPVVKLLGSICELSRQPPWSKWYSSVTLVWVCCDGRFWILGTIKFWPLTRSFQTQSGIFSASVTMDGVVVFSELYSAESGKTVDGRLCVRLLDQVLISAIFLVMWLHVSWVNNSRFGSC